MRVGDTVYLVPINDMARHRKGGILDNITEATIKKIGRKYFYLDGYQYDSYKFDFKSMVNVTNYCASWQVYLSMDDIKNEVEYNELLKETRDVFTPYGRINVTLNQLRKIKEILTCQE